MLTLTEQQLLEMADCKEIPLTVLDPSRNATYVLIPRKLYERLIKADYDDSPWTDQELDALAAEVDELLDDDWVTGST